jgi:uncharacterized protein
MKADDVSHDFVGRGWAFPIRTDPTGRISLVAREHEIEESIGLILRTAPGERPMRPDYGCGIHDYVFAGLDTEVIGRVVDEVRAALLRWEPRITVDDVVVTPASDRPGLAYVDIRYSVRDSNEPRNLVFPFYTIGEEA